MADFWGGVAKGFAPAYESALARREREEKEEKAEKARKAAAALAAAKVKEDLRRWKAEQERLKATDTESKRRWDLEQRAKTAKVDLDKQIREKAEQQKMEDIRGKLTATGIPQQQEAFKIRGGFPMEGLEPGVDARTLTPTPEQFKGLKRGELVQAQMRATALQEKQGTIEAEQRAKAAKLDPKWTAPTASDSMSPSQRRIKDLLKLMHPDATDKELALKEWEHYERKGLSATDKGASDIVNVFEKWQKASALIDEKESKGEKPTPDELRQFAVYELEIQDHFGRRGRKVPGALLETMKKVWRFPTAAVEEGVLGAQDVAIQAEQLVEDLDYLVEEFGQDQLNKHVGLWDNPLDDFRKTLGVAAGSKHFKALQSFKQVYQGILNETLKLRSGAAVTPSEWARFQKEIGVPTSADFYDRLRTFASKSRRTAQQRLQTKLKARYIFSDEIQKEIMEGLAPLKPKEEGGIPELPQGKPEEVEPVTPTPAPTPALPPAPTPVPMPPAVSKPTPPKKTSAAEIVELEGLMKKGVNNLTPAEKIKLQELLKGQLNK